MPLFSYKIIDKTGQVKSGVIQGERSTLTKNFNDQGQHLVFLKKSSHTKTLMKLKNKILLEFFYHLKKMMDANLSLQKAVDFTATLSWPRPFKKKVLTLQYNLKSGQSFYDSLPDSDFDHVIKSFILQGESSGSLNQSISAICDYLQERESLKNHLVKKLTYPLFLFLFITVMIYGLGKFVMPSVADFVMVSTNTKNQSLASVLLGSYVDFMDHYALTLFGIIAILFSALFYMNKSFLKVSRFIINLPVIKHFYKPHLENLFLHLLSKLLLSQIPLKKALDILQHSFKNLWLKETINNIQKSIESGVSFQNSLNNDQYFLSPYSRNLLNMAEESAQLPSIMNQCWVYEKERQEKRLHNLVTWTEPLSIVTIGGVLLWAVMALLGPLYDSFEFMAF